MKSNSYSPCEIKLIIILMVKIHYIHYILLPLLIEVKYFQLTFSIILKIT